MLDHKILKQARANISKVAFSPMTPEAQAAAAAGGGAPPMDPAMMAPGGAPPMDPSMMDPSMMAPGGAPPMDPAMMDPAMMPPGDPGMMPPGDPGMMPPEDPAAMTPVDASPCVAPNSNTRPAVRRGDSWTMSSARSPARQVGASSGPFDRTARSTRPRSSRPNAPVPVGSFTDPTPQTGPCGTSHRRTGVPGGRRASQPHAVARVPSPVSSSRQRLNTIFVRREALRRMYGRFQRFIRAQVAAHRNGCDDASLPDEAVSAWALVGLGNVANISRELGLLTDRGRQRLIGEVGRLLLGPR